QLVCVQTNQPTSESCNGLDDNCDTAVDENNPGGGGSCGTGQQGECAAGTNNCQGGQLVCTPDNSPGPEICDGLDNDCDGTVDDGNPGGGGSCATGLFGECAAGTTTCQGGQLACVQDNQPTAEQCNGLDDDCDGTADDGNPGGGAACNTGQLGVCAIGVMTCQAGGLSCVAVTGPTTEVCGDGQDNDCDGSTDEGCECDPLNPAVQCGTNNHCYPQPSGVPLCTPPVGAQTHYDYCVSDADCDATSMCINVGGTSAVCLQMCRVGFNTDCGGFPDDSCSTLSTPIYVGSQQWGVCFTGGTAPDDWTCTDTYYNAADGCDCGCGIFDPDCSGPTKAACDYCDDGCGNLDCWLGGCTDFWCDIDPNDNSHC
ncbi:MAG: hypothetical protein JRI68_29810, partial [Deltaproteobacteria bacterium]|nr:hypothetical protein [Deltaproteobacteria bacterium]